MRGYPLFLCIVLVAGCSKSDDAQSENKVVEARVGSGSNAPRAKSEQVTPPFDVKTPPADATKTASGLIYKKLVSNDAGPKIQRNDTATIFYTGWKQTTGETFFTNKTRGKPMPLNLTQSAPGFIEGMQLLHKGERAMLWLPPAIGYKTPPAAGAETLVYEIEVVDIQAAPAVPADVAGPPADAQTTKGGIKYVVARAGSGKDQPRSFDNVTFTYTAWEGDGHMVDTLEMGKKPATRAAPMKQAAPLAEILTTMVTGERVRFWADAAKMQNGVTPPTGMPTGQLCYEVEVTQIEKGIEPPVTPPDVAKPPGEAKKTALGTYYKVLKAAAKSGDHPKPTDTVRVHYSGWTTDGKMFDSTANRGEPAEFSLQGVVAGWTDGIPLMQIGDKFRFWIPESLAYKGAPGKPAGMLVFDVELLAINPPPKPQPHIPPGFGGMPPSGMMPHPQ